MKTVVLFVMPNAGKNDRNNSGAALALAAA
jgi:hypothetical protein